MASMPEEDLGPGGPRQLFDLSDSEGVNASERILTKLCQRSFLRLWSYTNIFTDEGHKDGKGDGKEFSDALVVFGREVIIFSDKHVRFQDDKDVSIAWARWFRRAVLESCKQLYGAMSWAKRFPARLFLDAKCTRPLPVQVPAGDVRFHLVAVTRGSREATLKYHGNEGLGSLRVDTEIEGDAHTSEGASPFVVGKPVPSKHFVHVIDEVSIERLLGELDTTADFLGYLRKREELFTATGAHVMAFGEEDLLAAYLQTMSSDESEHVFFNAPAGGERPDLLVFDADWFAGLQNSRSYLRKKQADQVSYLWDELIGHFTELGDPRIHAQYVEQAPEETEQALRVMASESRFKRRQLSETLRGLLLRARGAGRVARLFPASAPEEVAYVFLAMPKRADEEYAQYRLSRIAILHAYVQTAKLKSPLAKAIVGVAVDHPDKDYAGGSEDLFMLRKDEWTDDELAELDRQRQILGLWGDAMEYSRYRQDEFPQEAQLPALRRVQPDDLGRTRVDESRTQRAAVAAKTKAQKDRRRRADASRKKNRMR